MLPLSPTCHDSTRQAAFTAGVAALELTPMTSFKQQAANTCSISSSPQEEKIPDTNFFLGLVVSILSNQAPTHLEHHQSIRVLQQQPLLP
jgi:hypothetical protein